MTVLIFSSICACLTLLAMVMASAPTGDVDLLAVLFTISVAVMSLPPFIAHIRKTTKRKMIYVLSYMWFVPFSFLISLCWAISGKTDQDLDAPNTRRLDTRHYNRTETADETFSEKPHNPIDRFFWWIGHIITGTFKLFGRGVTSSATAIVESKVIRTVFKILLITVAVFCLITVVGLTNRYASRGYVSRPAHQTYQPTFSRPVTNPQPKKSAEQIWFERAAASMK